MRRGTDSAATPGTGGAVTGGAGSGPPPPEEVAAAALAALGSGERGWFVGGCLRDQLLGLPVRDLDVAVDGAPEPFARALADRLGAGVFSSSDEFGTWRLVLGGLHVDVAALRGADLEADLRARDFTVDALARPLEGGEVADLLGGMDDLAARRLRLCAPAALDDDPLRVLRLARLARGLGFVPDAAATEAAFRAAPRLAAVSGERQRDELSALLAVADAPAAFRDLAVWGALRVVLPELDGLRGVEQNPYHHLDVFEHTLEALTYVRGVVEQLGEPAHLATPDDAGLPGAAPLVPVSWAVLLHDIGKPAARVVDAEGRVIFWRHDEEGRRMTEGIAARLRFSNRFATYLGTLVRQHLRLGFLVREQPLTRRALARYRRDVSPWVFESVVVSLCDRLATRGERTSAQSLAKHYRLARTVWSEVSKAPPPRILSGDEVMELLGLEPGPDVGEALKLLGEEVEAGEIATPAEARAFLREWWDSGAGDEEWGARECGPRGRDGVARDAENGALDGEDG